MTSFRIIKVSSLTVSHAQEAEIFYVTCLLPKKHLIAIGWISQKRQSFIVFFYMHSVIKNAMYYHYAARLIWDSFYKNLWISVTPMVHILCRSTSLALGHHYKKQDFLLCRKTKSFSFFDAKRNKFVIKSKKIIYQEKTWFNPLIIIETS